MLVIGAALAEELYSVVDVPPRGGHAWMSHIASTVGGSAFNVLRNLVRLGHAPMAALAVGTGPAATRVTKKLDALGVRSVLPKHEQDNGTCLTLVTPDAERTFLTVGGCETDWSAQRLAGLEAPTGAVVYISGFQLVAVGGHLAEWSARLHPDARLVIDPGARCAELVQLPGWRALSDRCDLLTLNTREAAVLLGAEPGYECPKDPGTGLETGLAGWAQRHGCDVVLRRGPAGATWLPADGSGPVHAQAVPVRVVDTDGAGDAHTAGIMAALAGGVGPKAALELAAEAAAQVVARVGP